MGQEGTARDVEMGSGMLVEGRMKAREKGKAGHEKSDGGAERV